MNERGRGTLLLRPSFQFPYLSNSRVLKIYLPPKTDPQVMLEQWIEAKFSHSKWSKKGGISTGMVRGQLAKRIEVEREMDG